jgi:RND superfamily putative drug exporter
MAAWVLRHRRLVIGTWCLLFAVSAPFAWRVQDVLKGASDGVPGSPSVDTITRAVDGGIPAGTFFPFLVLLTSDGIPVNDTRFQAAAQEIERRLAGQPDGGAVRSFWNTGREDLLGRDRHTALILFRTNAARLNDAEALTPAVRAAVHGAALPNGFRVLVTGTAPMFFDLGRQSSADLLRAERVGLPVTLIILLVVFGAPLAAGLPVVLALLAVTVSSAGLFFLSQITTVSVFSQNVVSMIGPGVGVDYALFIVSSFRNALAQGCSARESAARAVSGAGHTIVVSGLAVAIGFSALFLVNVPFLQSMAAGGIFVVVTAVAASLTILPIALSYAGTSVNWPRRQQEVPQDGTGVWGRWAGVVMRRPWRFLVAGLAILAVFVAPVLRLQAWNVGVDGLSPPGGLNSFIVLVLFTILFGLSMDYHIFLLDRVTAAFVATGDTVRAVSLGLQQTAGLISSAALVMVSIFGSFAFTRLAATRELGLGLAFAVALDATLIRLILVPALMTLLGAYNWWVPLYSGRDRSRQRALRDHAVESCAGGGCGRVIGGG